MSASTQKLRTIWFEGEMLPREAQLLDVGAQLCTDSSETRDWFARFTHGSGVDDARTIAAEASSLRIALRTNRRDVAAELERNQGDAQAAKIVEAWEYTLDTMIDVANASKTCSWILSGADEMDGAEPASGEIENRSV